MKRISQGECEDNVESRRLRMRTPAHPGKTQPPAFVCACLGLGGDWLS